ncbi:MAG: DNA repair protein RecN (Recombination protein N) [Oleiphilaceae bacterium]|jgi:DNA repair protein RecN (Recombination protein N)
MLNQITVSNFAIADHIEVLFNNGMTVLSGETGAGKSIILDALGLTLGDRADTSMVRHGEDKADISATFDLEHQAIAQAWLKDHDLEDGKQCILRRVITAEGRSRGYINGHPSPLQNLKAIGELLIDIHSQHEHQSLLEKDNHRIILDNFAQINELSENVVSHFQDWNKKSKHLAKLENNQDEVAARIHLLTFQVEELKALNLLENEVSDLEQEQAELANAELLLSKTHTALALCDEEETNISSMISHASSSLMNLPCDNEKISESLTLLNEAQIQIDEASNNLRDFIDSFELNPERLKELEERLSILYQLARKHRCEPDELISVQKKLSQELEHYTHGDQNLEELQEEVLKLEKNYFEIAEQQRQARLAVAKDLEDQISEQLALMDMKSVKFVASFSALERNKVNQHGIDSVEFLISTNPGQPPKAINKVASGGELSRISLAVQVIIAQSSTIPTLVFDEVDVGIGGGTAQIVGKLLNNLGKKGQVICVTHLPQVASQGDNHFFISKREVEGSVRSSIDLLNAHDRTKEIARMLGGIKITEQTLAHAKEMIEFS